MRRAKPRSPLLLAPHFKSHAACACAPTPTASGPVARAASVARAPSPAASPIEHPPWSSRSCAGACRARAPARQALLCARAQLARRANWHPAQPSSAKLVREAQWAALLTKRAGRDRTAAAPAALTVACGGSAPVRVRHASAAHGCAGSQPAAARLTAAQEQLESARCPPFKCRASAGCCERQAETAADRGGSALAKTAPGTIAAVARDAGAWPSAALCHACEAAGG